VRLYLPTAEKHVFSWVVHYAPFNPLAMTKLLIEYLGCLALSCICSIAYGQFITNTGVPLVNSAVVKANGDWTNDTGTNILNNGIIETTAAFVNNGTLDLTSHGGFVLNYATDFSFIPGGPEMGFLAKSGAGAALVTGTLSIKDSLLLNEGIVRLLNATDTVSLKSNSSLVASPSSYVEGLVARAGTGNLIFPFGKDGLYLPLKIYKVNAQKVTASVVNAPASHTAGPGVDALIGFPYAWQVTGKVPEDTAAYIEVNYPSSLPSVTNLIVVREVNGTEYASMGARFIHNSGTRITVKSYSRRLNGLFTVAQGFPSDFVTDSLALVAVYQSNGGPGWLSQTNWLTGNVETWYGVTVNGQSITSVDLSNNNLAGPLADPLVDILSLQSVNISGNDITAIPDFTLNPEITSLNVSDNHLDFASLEPNAAITGINYLIQADVGDSVDAEIPVGSSFEFSIPSGGESTQYQWKRNGELVVDATQPTFLLPAISRQTMGEYVAELTNPKLPGLTLKSAVQKVLAYADVSGKLYADVNVPAEQGDLTLYKVQPGAFERVVSVPVQTDGSYTFNRMILDNYQIRGFADTLVYTSALPTYYKNTIFWEEADTLFLENNLTDLNITSQIEPGPPSGRGVISGYLQEDDGTGRVKDPEKNKRVAQAGVSARRVERTGRTKGEILTLVAYVFTNEEGEFTLPNLSVGEYRLNFEYPGYPMNHASYTTVMIGTAFESQVMVEASVIDGKISVSKLVITGLYEAEGYQADVFPNPAVEYIQMKFPREANGRVITFSDMTGRTVQQVSAEQKEATLDVKDFQKGVYILQINENGVRVKTVKVSIE
jgi:hypothetical protein